MLTKTQANTALNALAQDVGVAKLELDQSNTALIAFGDTHELIFHFLPERSGFQFWAPLHHFTLSGDAEADLALLRHILEKNFPTVSLNGSYFALDSSVGVVLLGRYVPLDGAVTTDFIETTKVFADQVVHLSKSLQGELLRAREMMTSGQDSSDEDMTLMRI